MPSPQFYYAKLGAGTDVLPRQRNWQKIVNFSFSREVFLLPETTEVLREHFMVKKEKEILVQELTEKIKKNNGMVLTQYQGLTVAEISELRSQLRNLKCEYTVVKNTLSKIATKNAGLEKFSEYFDGPTAIAIENGDIVAPAKVIVNFAKRHNKLKIKAGVLEKKIISENEIRALAELPSKEVLLSILLGTMKAPITNFVNVLQANIRNLVYVLEAIRKQKDSAKG
ncbi:MAG: 50S ribosomal protein L10 [Elusimicrobia bacterium]|nr:50S ribosomal protein L10 [Elusimicrobiota bacterium]